MEYCHFFDSAERKKHEAEVKPCVNCGIPVCSSCRNAKGLCVECASMGDDQTRLHFREVAMKDFYTRAREAGIA